MNIIHHIKDSTQTAVRALKPLSPFEKGILIAYLGCIVLLFCITLIVVLLFDLLLLSIFFALAIGLARFGMSRIVTPFIYQLVRLVRIPFGIIRFSKSDVYGIPLNRDEAPELFQLVEATAAKVKMQPPQEIYLLIGMDAWIRLKGFKKSGGKSTLALGYDMLAAMPQAELESVIAHEMAHAKLVQRGFKKLSAHASQAMGIMAYRYTVNLSNARRASKDNGIPEFHFNLADWFARISAKAVAAYSRQDEFEADRLSADVTNGNICKSALKRVYRLGEKSQRLQWRDRLIKLNSVKSYTHWLQTKLADDESPESIWSKEVDLLKEETNHYSTHPSLSDRLAALPETGDTVPATGSSIHLLKNPDELAHRLISEVERKIESQENEDSVELDRWVRKLNRSRGRMTQLVLGIIFVISGIIMGIVFFSGDMTEPVLLVIALVLGGVGAAALFWPRPKVKLLPIPKYVDWDDSFEKYRKLKDIDAVEKQIENELRDKTSGMKSPKEKIAFYINTLHDGYGKGDYLTGFTASRLAHQLNQKSFDAITGLGIGAAFFNNQNLAAAAIEDLSRKAKIDDGFLWGSAWIYLLSGRSAEAESLLRKLITKKDNESTLWVLLALLQTNRNKRHSAMKNIQRALELESTSEKIQLVYSNIALTCGRADRALQQLQILSSRAAENPDITICMIRLFILLDQNEELEKWLGDFHSRNPKASMILRVAGFFESADRQEQAVEYYRMVLEKGFYPEAHLALARYHYNQKNEDLVRKHLTEGMNAMTALGDEDAQPVANLLNQFIIGILSFEKSRIQCSAWIVTMDLVNSPLKASKFPVLVYAPSSGQAMEYAQKIYELTHPGVPPPLHRWMKCESADILNQPKDPVYPGVQRIHYS